MENQPGFISLQMKWLIPLCLGIIVTQFSYAQDSATCICSYMVKPKYPKMAEENKISGTVLIELDLDSFYLYSNPVIKKSLGYGCDEEALRIVKQLIEKQNACRRKCYIKPVCTPRKVIQTVNFILPED